MLLLWRVFGTCDSRIERCELAEMLSYLPLLLNRSLLKKIISFDEEEETIRRSQKDVQNKLLQVKLRNCMHFKVVDLLALCCRQIYETIPIHEMDTIDYQISIIS